MLFQLEPVRPAVLNRVTQTMQRADAGIAAPGKYQPGHAAHADELIVNEIRRHADERQSFPALTDNLVAGGMGNKMREALERDGVAVADGGLDSFGERGNTRHAGYFQVTGPYLRLAYRQGQMAIAA